MNVQNVYGEHDNRAGNKTLNPTNHRNDGCDHSDDEDRGQLTITAIKNQQEFRQGLWKRDDTDINESDDDEADSNGCMC